MNVIYIPKCAKIVVMDPGNPGLVLQSLAPSLHALTVNDGYTALCSLTVQIVRRGLPQGSLLSPLLARSVIATYSCLLSRVRRSGSMRT